MSGPIHTLLFQFPINSRIASHTKSGRRFSDAWCTTGKITETYTNEHTGWQDKYHMRRWVNQDLGWWTRQSGKSRRKRLHNGFCETGFFFAPTFLTCSLSIVTGRRYCTLHVAPIWTWIIAPLPTGICLKSTLNSHNMRELLNFLVAL